MYSPGSREPAAAGPAEDAPTPRPRPAPPPPFTIFPAPSRPTEPRHRRGLAAVGVAYQWVEVLLDRLVSAPLNPLYHSGTIAVFSLAVALVTGIYLFLFYRVGTEAAHRSIEDIMAQPLGIGALMRSLHRYSSDAALLAAARQPSIRAVVSLAAFAHPAAMMRRWLAGMHIPFWPLGAYILAYVQRVIGYRFDDIAPCATIAKLRCPTLIVHGLADATVPVAEARQIYAARTSEAVELLLVPGSHDDYGDLAQQVGLLGGFLDRAFR